MQTALHVFFSISVSPQQNVNNGLQRGNKQAVCNSSDDVELTLVSFQLYQSCQSIGPCQVHIMNQRGFRVDRLCDSSCTGSTPGCETVEMCSGSGSSKRGFGFFGRDILGWWDVAGERRWGRQKDRGVGRRDRVLTKRSPSVDQALAHELTGNTLSVRYSRLRVGKRASKVSTRLAGLTLSDDVHEMQGDLRRRSET